MDKKLRIRKVKVTSDNKIEMKYEKQTKYGGWDEYSFISSEKARPSFYARMHDLNIHVLEMCELPEGYLERINVRSVSVNYGGDKEVMGATISATMKLNNSNCGLNLNTPNKAEDSYSDAPPDDMQLLSEDCIDALYSLYDECYAYIDGERAQGKLFDVAS